MLLFEIGWPRPSQANGRPFRRNLGAHDCFYHLGARGDVELADGTDAAVRPIL